MSSEGFELANLGKQDQSVLTALNCDYLTPRHFSFCSHFKKDSCIAVTILACLA